MKEQIYLAEDDEAIRKTIRAFLESEGYRVRDFATGDALLQCFLEEPCDLVLLDVLMPGSSGFVITKQIRDKSTVPIIILSAKDSDLDYATGINLGSDDYFTKPFSALALVMRVKAILRRVALDRESFQDHTEDTLSFFGLTLDKKTKKVRYEETVLSLTPIEYSFLVYLTENSDRAVSREELLDKVWGYGNDVESRACDDTVRRLRKKLAGTKIQIETIWGFGFTLKGEYAR